MLLRKPQEFESFLLIMRANIGAILIYIMTYVYKCVYVFIYICMTAHTDTPLHIHTCKEYIIYIYIYI